MIKGARRQMIVLRTGNSKYFDEAYFVLRHNVGEYATGRGDILDEANRILAENTAFHRQAGRAHRLRWPFFLAGLLCGAICAVGILCLVFL